MTKRVLLFVVLAICLSACWAGTNPAVMHGDAVGEIAGFWQGLWHGFIAVPAFFLSLFEPTVRVYEVHNVGNFYDLGFMLGIGALGGGAGRASRSER